MRDIATSPDGIPIHFDVDGIGSRALVFVHGWSCDRTYWNHQMPAFAERYRVVAVDLAGHGDSGTARREWTMPAFGRDVVAVVDELGLEEIVLIGHSMGGDVIVEAALMLGNRVAGLVWVDTYPTLGEPIGRDEVEALLEPFRRDFVGETRSFVRGMFPPTADPALVERIAADMSAAPPDIAIDAMDHSFSNEGPVIAGLGSLASPIAAIAPDYEPTDAESLLRHRVHAIVMTGVGHFPMLEDPVRFNELLGEIVGGFD